MIKWRLLAALQTYSEYLKYIYLCLLQVGQKNNALQTLHDTITNKRYQRNWTIALEQVCFNILLIE